MRTLLLSAFLFLTAYAHAQLIITHKVVDDFNATLQKSHAKPEMIEEINSFGNGLMILTIDKIDTLNRKDLKDFSHVHVEPYVLDTDKITNKVTERKLAPVNEDMTYQPIPYGSIHMLGKGITINTFSWEPTERYTIANGKLSNKYEMYSKYDAIYRLKLADKKVNSLVIPMQKLIVKLNTSNFKVGGIIYGEVNFVTQPFYVDNYSFKSGYIIMRIHSKYIFTAPIQPEQFTQ